MAHHIMDLLATPTRRKFLFAALYLSEGAPIGFVWWALPTRLRAAGVQVGLITSLTALLVLPWAFKFLWAPLVDVLRTARWGLRHWIVAAQLVMGLTLLPLFWLQLPDDFLWLAVCLLVHAVAAATQDVAIDALCISVVGEHERGQVNGWMQAGMLLGRSVMGGGALMMAIHVGDAAVFGLLLALVWSSMVLVVMSREPEVPSAFAPRHTGDNQSAALNVFRSAPNTSSGADEVQLIVQPTHLGRRITAFAQSLRTALRQRNTWLGLLFALLAGAAFEGAGAIAGPYLVDEGLSQQTIGYFFAAPMVAAMIFGSLIGGRLADRTPRKRAVLIAVVYVSLTVAALGLVDALVVTSDTAAETDLRSLSVLLCLEAMYFGVGLLTAASYALFMDITNKDVAATQFSTFMGATNGCESWSALAIGRMAGGWGYAAAFLTMSGLALGSLPVLASMRLPRADAENSVTP